MCSICLNIPCLRGCPNKKEEKPVYTCSICEEPIYDGEVAYLMGNDVICCDCIEDAEFVVHREEE